MKNVLFPRQTTESPSKKDSKIKSIQALHFQIHHTESTFLVRVEFLSMPDIKFYYSDVAIVLFPSAFRHPLFDEGDHTRTIVPHSVVQRDANVTPRDAVSRIAAADCRWFIN